MKIIVTGGAGYIGSHTVVELIKSGYTPIILDNLSNTDIRNIDGINQITGKNIKFYNIDCTDSNAVKSVFDKEKDILGIVHFAAFKSVEESVRLPDKYFKNNVGSLEVILDQMQQFNINNIIFSSSCTVYGSPEKLPVTESTPFKKSESPYGETKQLCEDILNSSSIKSISLRYFNPIGSHSTGLIGDCSADKPSNLVPIICEVASGKREKLVVNGNNYNTIDGTCVRDYIHVVDLAKSHVKALEYLLRNTCKEVFNIGTGKGLSVLQVIQAFETANQINLNYSIGPRRDGDVEQIYSDNKKVTDLLNWSSKISTNTAMKDAWKWEKNKLN